MRRDPTLSEEVQSYIQSLDWENEHGLTAEEKKKLEEGHKLVRGIVHYVLTSREQLAEYQFEELELFVQGAPDLVAEFLNQHYTREAEYAFRKLNYFRRKLAGFKGPGGTEEFLVGKMLQHGRLS